MHDHAHIKLAALYIRHEVRKRGSFIRKHVESTPNCRQNIPHLGNLTQCPKALRNVKLTDQEAIPPFIRARKPCERTEMVKRHPMTTS